MRPRGVPLAGTERGVSPFYSPDGKWIAFATTDGVLRKLPASGEGGAVTLARADVAAAYKFGAWLEDGSIVYTLSRRIARVSFEGSPMPPPNIAKSLRGGLEKNDVQSVSPLPRARGFLFSICPNNCSIGSAVWVFDAAADSARLLLPQVIGAWYVHTGHVVYTSREGGVFAVPFDVNTLRVTGGAFALIDGVLPGKFAVSASGRGVVRGRSHRGISVGADVGVAPGSGGTGGFELARTVRVSSNCTRWSVSCGQRA